MKILIKLKRRKLTQDYCCVFFINSNTDFSILLNFVRISTFRTLNGDFKTSVGFLSLFTLCLKSSLFSLQAFTWKKEIKINKKYIFELLQKVQLIY